MKSFLTSILKGVSQFIVGVFEQSAKNRTAKELLSLSDKQLKDIGVCRIKLYKGASAYPWRIEETSVIVNLPKAKSSASLAVEQPVPSQNIAA